MKQTNSEQPNNAHAPDHREGYLIGVRDYLQRVMGNVRHVCA